MLKRGPWLTYESSFSLALSNTPGKYKIYLSSPEVDNISLQRGQADTGQNMHRCIADTGPVSLWLFCAKQKTQEYNK